MKHNEVYYKSPVFKDYSIKNELMYNMFNDFALSYPSRRVINEVDNIVKHKCHDKK